jgi:hypothetical protein
MTLMVRQLAPDANGLPIEEKASASARMSLPVGV